MRYRLRTLLILMGWIALVAAAIRQPNAAWSGVIAFLTLTSLLTAALLMIFRAEARTAAIGYFVFCCGYLVYVSQASEFSVLKSGLSDANAIHGLFTVVHPDRWFAMAVGGEVLLPSPYDARFFAAVCHHAVACVLGLIGMGVAQWMGRESD
jgi:hypothetical protein